MHFDSSKDIWFAEYGNSRVVRLAHDPQTNKWAPAESVSVPGPIAVLTDDDGVLYIACQDQKIWKYQGGVLTHWATTEHIDPKCMAWGPYGRLWVTCNDGHHIDVFNPSGGSPVYTRPLWNVAGITSGPDWNLDGVPDMYVNDRRNYVHVLSGKDSDWLGLMIDNAPELGQAIGMTFGPDANADGTRDLYVCDWNNSVTRIYSGRPPYNHIRLLNNDRAYFIAAYPPLPSKLTSDGFAVGVSNITALDRWVTYNMGVNTLAVSDPLNNPYAAAMLPDGSFWVTSIGDQVVRRFVRTAENQWTAAESFEVPQPTGVAIGPDGAVYVASDSTNLIYRWDGSNLTQWAGPVPNGPRGIAFGPGGRLWVCCIDSDLLQVWTADGLVDQVSLGSPVGIAVGPDQTGDGVPDIYVANNSQQVHVVDSVRMRHWDRWVHDPARLLNLWGVTAGLDQDFDGVPDIYTGHLSGGQPGINIYSGRTGAYIRQLNNDPVGHVAAYPLIYPNPGQLPLAGEQVVVYSYNCDEHGNWYLAPGVGFPDEWSFGWAVYDTDPKPWGGRLLGSFNTTNVLGLRGLPPHRKVTVSFDLILIGVAGEKWDGQGVSGDEAPDRFRCYVQGTDGVAFESFSQDASVVQSYPYGAGGVVYPGLTGSSRQAVNTDAGHTFSEWRNLSFTFDHTDQAVNIVFEYGASQPNERYMLDNIRVAVAVDEPPLPPFEGSIGEAKTKEVGRTIILEGKAVTAFFFEADLSQSLYVEEEDRSSGIKVYPAEFTFVMPGDRVKVTGKLQTDSNQETSIGQAVVEVLGNQPPLEPLGVTNRGLTAAEGLDTTGLLVRTWGRVTAIDGEYFFVDDGSGYSEGAGPSGLRVRGNCPASVGGYVKVTGIRARQMVGQVSVPVIRMRADSDAVSVE